LGRTDLPVRAAPAARSGGAQLGPPAARFPALPGGAGPPAPMSGRPDLAARRRRL